MAAVPGGEASPTRIAAAGAIRNDGTPSPRGPRPPAPFTLRRAGRGEAARPKNFQVFFIFAIATGLGRVNLLPGSPINAFLLGDGAAARPRPR